MAYGFPKADAPFQLITKVTSVMLLLSHYELKSSGRVDSHPPEIAYRILAKRTSGQPVRMFESAKRIKRFKFVNTGTFHELVNNMVISGR